MNKNKAADFFFKKKKWIKEMSRDEGEKKEKKKKEKKIVKLEVFWFLK